MNDNLDPNTIKENVLEKVKHDQVKMRSRWYYSLKNLILILVIVIAVAIALYIDSYIFFAMDKSALWYLPGFGWQGLVIFFFNLPWILIGLVVAAIILLEYLVTRYAFAYRQPLIYSALGLIILITAVSVGVKATTIHESIEKRVEAGKMPLAKPLYQQIGMPKPKNVSPGMVIEINNNEFEIQRPNGCPAFIRITAQTRLPQNFIINSGDYVLIIGRTSDGYITAEAIRRAPPKLFSQPIPEPPTVESCSQMK